MARETCPITTKFTREDTYTLLSRYTPRRLGQNVSSFLCVASERNETVRPSYPVVSGGLVPETSRASLQNKLGRFFDSLNIVDALKCKIFRPKSRRGLFTPLHQGWQGISDCNTWLSKPKSNVKGKTKRVTPRYKETRQRWFSPVYSRPLLHPTPQKNTQVKWANVIDGPGASVNSNRGQHCETWVTDVKVPVTFTGTCECNT